MKNRFLIKNIILLLGVCFLVGCNNAKKEEVVSDNEPNEIVCLGFSEQNVQDSISEDDSIYVENQQTVSDSNIQDEETSDDSVVVIQRDDILPYEKDGFIVFGAYEQDGDLENGPEPIEWEILDSNENGTLLISRYILDVLPYDNERNDVGWEECSLRKWLNADFINLAFTKNEQVLINTTNIVNSNDPRIFCNRRATQDKVFCLSLFEIEKYFNYINDDKYAFEYHSQDLIVSPTFYSKEKGVFTYPISEEEYYEYYYTTRYNYTIDCIGKEGGEWWLRTPGIKVPPIPQACIVNPEGTFGENISRLLDDEEIGIRPAMYIEY